MPRSVLILLVCAMVAQFSSADDPPGLHHVFQATPTVYTGGEPEGITSFQSLREMGVRTIVSVDGATPNVEEAARHGIRYIHIPIGYDGIPKDSALSLVRVAREAERPIYVHCHHGKHRGPAAAAVVCLASGSITYDEAAEYLTKVGTGKEYPGLWRDVIGFRIPSKEVELPELVAVAEISVLTTEMARLDRHFDHLRAFSKTDWKANDALKDLTPVSEALLVQESLKECLRSLDNTAAPGLRQHMSDSVTLATELHTHVVASDFDAADALLKKLENTCVQCHTAFRNR